VLVGVGKAYRVLLLPLLLEKKDFLCRESQKLLSRGEDLRQISRGEDESLDTERSSGASKRGRLALLEECRWPLGDQGNPLLG